MRATLLVLLLAGALFARADEEDPVLETHPSGGSLGERLEALERDWEAGDEPREAPDGDDAEEPAPVRDDEERPPATPTSTVGEASPSVPAASGPAAPGKRGVAPTRPDQQVDGTRTPAGMRARPDVTDPAE